MNLHGTVMYVLSVHSIQLQTHDGDCNPTFKFSDIPMEYYNCALEVHYAYLNSDYVLFNSPTTTESCLFNKSKIVILNL